MNRNDIKRGTIISIWHYTSIYQGEKSRNM